MFKTFAVATALLAGSAFADELPPDAVVGRWTGKREQTFALADSSNAASWECLGSGKSSSRDVTVEIGADGKVSVSAMAAEEIAIGAAKFTVPAVAAQEYMWAAWADNIAQLRIGSNLNQIVCQYVEPNDKTMVMIIRGGSDVTDNWALQCQSSTYSSLSGFDTAPVCNAAPGSKSPAVSTILYSLNYAGGVAGSGSEGLVASAAAVVGGAIVAGAAMLL